MAQRKAAAVSMEPELFEKAKARAKALHLPTFSAYVVQLIIADLRDRGELTIKEDGGGYSAPPSKAAVSTFTHILRRGKKP